MRERQNCSWLDITPLLISSELPGWMVSSHVHVYRRVTLQLPTPILDVVQTRTGTGPTPAKAKRLHLLRRLHRYQSTSDAEEMKASMQVLKIALEPLTHRVPTMWAHPRDPVRLSANCHAAPVVVDCHELGVGRWWWHPSGCKLHRKTDTIPGSGHGLIPT